MDGRRSRSPAGRVPSGARSRARRARGATSAAARHGRRSPSRRRRRRWPVEADGSRRDRSPACAGRRPQAAPRPRAPHRTRSHSAPAALPPPTGTDRRSRGRPAQPRCRACRRRRRRSRPPGSRARPGGRPARAPPGSAGALRRAADRAPRRWRRRTGARRSSRLPPVRRHPASLVDHPHHPDAVGGARERSRITAAGGRGKRRDLLVAASRPADERVREAGR